MADDLTKGDMRAIAADTVTSVVSALDAIGALSGRAFRSGLVPDIPPEEPQDIPEATGPGHEERFAVWTIRSWIRPDWVEYALRADRRGMQWYVLSFPPNDEKFLPELQRLQIHSDTLGFYAHVRQTATNTGNLYPAELLGLDIRGYPREVLDLEISLGRQDYEARFGPAR